MRERLSYANVMATVAVFIALGGGAYAALQLPKNSVTSKQLKKGAVKSKDIGKAAVRKKQLAKNSVNSSKVIADSLKGSDIDEASLGTVPNAERVGGSQVRQISYSAEPNTPAQQLFSHAGLTVTAQCGAALDDFVTLTATTDANDSIIGLPNQIYAGSNIGDIAAGVDNDFDAGEELSSPIDDTSATLVYGRGPGSSPVLSVNFLANQYVSGGGTCKVVGTVVTDG